MCVLRVSDFLSYPKPCLIIVVYDRYKRRKKPRLLEALLKDPFEIHFLILRATEHKVDYYPQDKDIHLLDELTLPSDSEADVMVRLVPNDLKRALGA